MTTFAKTIVTSSLVFLASSTAPAFAHFAIGHDASLAHGFMHPVSGIDHLLVMVAMGVIAARLGGRMMWLLPGIFVWMMAVGGILGFNGLNLPFVDQAIGSSVVVFGALVFAGFRIPSLVLLCITGIFAAFHGYAHGAELPVGNSAVFYASGFLAATSLLHGLGLFVGSRVMPKLWASHSRPHVEQ